MKNINLILRPLTKEAFAAYGDVIEVADEDQQREINYGLTTRHHKLSTVDVADGDGVPIISIFRTRAITLPFQIKVMERHPLGSQSFMPLSNTPYIVLVAGFGEFDPANPKRISCSAKSGS